MAEKKFKRQLRAEIARDQRRQARAELVELREDLRIAKARRTAARARAAERCRRMRTRARNAIKRRREKVRDELKLEATKLRAEVRERCAVRRARISASGKSASLKARALLDERRRYHRLIEGVGKRTGKAPARASRAERRQESDEAVIRNLPDDLTGVFRSVRRHIKGGPRKTRTEAFWEWAHDNPGEVLERQGDAAEREAGALIREHAKAERQAHRAAERSRAAAVPF